MSPWRKMSISIILGGVTILVWLAASQVSLRISKGQTQPPVAFTAMMRQTLFRFPSGVFVRTDNDIIAVRADGSRVTTYQRSDPGGRSLGMRVIEDSQKKMRVSIIDLVASTTTMPLASLRIKKLTEVPATCGAQPGAPTNVFHGVSAVRVLTGDSNSLHREEWRAPSLSCLAVKKTVFHKSADGKDVITNEVELMDVKIGEPDAALFNVPSTHREAPPSEVISLIFRPYPGVALPDEVDEDRAYYRAHSKSP